MKRMRMLLAATGLVIVTTASGLSQTAAGAERQTLEAFAQAQQQPATTRIKTWTRARFAAAQKRWAQNKAQFTDCQRQLEEERKTKRISWNNRVHFLEACMNRKP